MKGLKFISDHRYQIFKTILTYITFAGLGGTNTLIGSSILDLQIYVQQPFTKISQLVPIRAIGYVIGASSCSLFERFIDDYLALSLSCAVSGLFLIIAPWFKIIEIMFACIAFSGFGQGVFDIYCNVIILRIWDKNGVNWLQVLHMCFGIGALITPIFTRPFLLPNTEGSILSNDLDQSFSGNSSKTSLEANVTLVRQKYTPDDVMVQFSFLIVGGTLLLVSIPYFFCYLYDRKKREEAVKQDNNVETTTEVKLLRKLGAVFMAGILANFAFGTEAVVGNLATAFAVKAEVGMDKKTAVLVATVFWSMFSFYRVVFIPLTIFIKERRLFYMNLTIILAGAALLIPKAATTAAFTWSSFTLLGIGYSPVFAISYGSLGRYFPINNAMTSYIFVNGVIGETIHTTILSRIIDSNPAMFTYYLASMSVLYVIISLILPIYLRKVIGRPVRSINNEVK